MLPKSPADSPQSGFFDITHQLERSHPLLALGDSINWSELEKTFANHYSKKGRGAKPIRLMCGLLILKQMFDLSDKQVVEQWMMNPYYPHSAPILRIYSSVSFTHHINDYFVMRFYVCEDGRTRPQTGFTDADKALEYPSGGRLLSWFVFHIHKKLVFLFEFFSDLMLQCGIYHQAACHHHQ